MSGVAEVAGRELTLETMCEFEDAASSEWAPQVRALRAISMKDSDGEELSPRAWADWLTEDVPRVFPQLESLSLVGMQSKKSELERICRAGVFESLRVVKLRGSTLTTAVFGTVLAALEGASRLESLTLHACSLGKKQGAALTRSRLLERLRHLELGNNASLGAVTAKALAAEAGRCERLESLGLYRCGIAGAGAKALAQAEWAGPMARLNMAFNPIRTAGLVAFEEAGRLEWLFNHDGMTALALLDSGVDSRGLIALLESEQARPLQLIDFGYIPDAFDEKALRALLKWGRLGEVELPGVRFEFEGDAELYDEVEANAHLDLVEYADPEPRDGAHVVQWGDEDELEDEIGDYDRWAYA